MRIDEKHALFQKFRIILGKGVKPEDKDALIENALEVLDSNQNVFAVRKLAAQVVFRLRGFFEKNELTNSAVLVAFYEESTVEQFTSLLQHYVYSLENTGVLMDDSSLSLFTCIVQKCAKLKTRLKEIMACEDFEHIGYVLIDECMKFCDYRSEDLTHLVKGVLKFTCTKPNDFDKVFEYICAEYPLDFHPKYLLMALIVPNLSEGKLFSFLPVACDQLLTLACSYQGCAATAPYVVSLCSSLLNSNELEDMIFKAMTSDKGTSRVNSSRYWIGRLLGQLKLRPFLIGIMQKCERELEQKNILWPPHGRSAYEEVCCVSADWAWDEAEEVVWPRDLLIHAAIYIALGLSAGFTDKHPGYLSAKLMKSALRWHSCSTRLLAFQLLITLREKKSIIKEVDDEFDVKAETMSFILRNLNSDNWDLHSLVVKQSKIIIWDDENVQLFSTILLHSNSSEEAVLIALTVLQNTKDVDALRKLTNSESDAVRRRAISILKKNLENVEFLENACEDILEKDGLCTERSLDLLEWFYSVFGGERIWQVAKRKQKEDELGWISFLCHFVTWGGKIDQRIIENSKMRCEELLSLSGSSCSNECPTFPVLYENLDQAALSQKRFADLILRHLQLLSLCVSVSFLSASECLNNLFQVTMRCRHKAVVDHGTALLPQLLKGRNLSGDLFGRTLSLFLSDISQSRTLSISKTLHACCEEEPNLFDDFWTAVKNCLVANSASIVKIRAFKALKHFLIRENCPIATAPNIEWLFVHCIDVQKSNDAFLVKSAAVNLYGFVVNLLLSRRESVPLFVLIGNRPEFWKHLQRMVEQLSNSPTVCRVLLFSFLCKLPVISERFYSDRQLSRIRSLCSNLLSLLSSIGDARERRYLIECVVELIPYSEKAIIMQKVESSYFQCQTWVQRQTMGYLQYALDGYNDKERPSNSSDVIPTDILMCPFVSLIEKVREKVERVDDKELEEVINDVSRSLSLTHELPRNTYAYALALMGERMTHAETSSSLRTLWVFSMRNVLSKGGRFASLAARALSCMNITQDYLQPEAALEVLNNWMAVTRSFFSM